MNYERLCIYCMREKEDNERVCKGCGFDEGSYSPPPYALPEHTILHGRYMTGAILGSGGFGITYVAWDLMEDRKVAIKEYFVSGGMYRDGHTDTHVRTDGASFSQTKIIQANMGRFEKEGRLLSELSGLEGIVRTYDFFHENSTMYIVMEYLEGDTLKQYVENRGGRISWTEAVEKISPVLESLQKLHERGILHRDISPDNMIVLDQGPRAGSICLLDFGGAKELSAVQAGEKSTVMIRKKGYSPVEQTADRDKQGAWTDVYAMAATLYYCICGQAPCDAFLRLEDPGQLIRPSSVGVALTEEQEKVLLRGLEVKPADRYASMLDFVRALRQSTRSSAGSGFVISKDSSGSGSVPSQGIPGRGSVISQGISGSGSVISQGTMGSGSVISQGTSGSGSVSSQSIPGSGAVPSQSVPGRGASTSQGIPGSRDDTAQSIPNSRKALWIGVAAAFLAAAGLLVFAALSGNIPQLRSGGSGEDTQTVDAEITGAGSSYTGQGTGSAEAGNAAGEGTDAPEAIGGLNDSAWEEIVRDALDAFAPDDAASDAVGDVLADGSVSLMKGYADYEQEKYRQALKDFQEAADYGNTQALLAMAVMYQFGTGTPPDYERAEDLYAQAQAQGADMSGVESYREDLEDRLQMILLKDVDIFNQIAVETVYGTTGYKYDDESMQIEWDTKHNCVERVDNLCTYVECDRNKNVYRVYAAYEQKVYGISQAYPVVESFGSYQWDDFGDLTGSAQQVSHSQSSQAYREVLQAQEGAVEADPYLAAYDAWLNKEGSTTEKSCSGDRVNVRKHPGDGEVIGKLSTGESVQVITELESDWAMVDYDGAVGYVSTTYLE